MPDLNGRTAARLAIATAMTPLLQSCCAICGLWCGPDTSNWVQVSWETPEKALSSTLEAIRRENYRVLYQALSERFKTTLATQFLGPGEKLDEIRLAIVWEKLADDISGLHLAGTAEAKDRAKLPDGRLAFQLEVHGREFELLFARFPYYKVAYLVDGERAFDENYLKAELRAQVELIKADDLQWILKAATPPLFLENPKPGDIDRIEIGHVWKLDAARGLTDG